MEQNSHLVYTVRYEHCTRRGGPKKNQQFASAGYRFVYKPIWRWSKWSPAEDVTKQEPLQCHPYPLTDSKQPLSEERFGQRGDRWPSRATSIHFSPIPSQHRLPGHRRRSTHSPSIYWQAQLTELMCSAEINHLNWWIYAEYIVSDIYSIYTLGGNVVLLYFFFLFEVRW